MKKFLLNTHRILGTAFSILFVVWFLSGFVMIYHHFPVLGNKGSEHLVPLPDSLPNITVIGQKTAGTNKLKEITFTTFRNKPVLNITNGKASTMHTADTLLAELKNGVPFTELNADAQLWNSAQIIRTDTLNRLDQWIPYSQYKAHFPIYKFYFDDDARSILYLSSQTGEALQYVNRQQRIWAWAGPIPHMLYFWQFRQHRDRWITFVSWMAGIGSVMCLTGIVVGMWHYAIVYHRKKQLRTPYKNVLFRWHHILGFIFGFFVFMFALSGLFSFNELPQWMVKTHDTAIASRAKASTPLNLKLFKADYNQILEKHKGNVKQFKLMQYGTKPYYSAIIGNTTMNFDASSDSIGPLYLSSDDVLQRLSEVVDKPLNIELMTEYDNYYVGFTKRMKLPVYKATATNADESTFYVDPETGTTRYFNKSLKAKKWIYPAFHSLRFKYFAEHRTQRDILLWTVMIGGTLVSMTGFVMGCRYFIRKTSRKCTSTTKNHTSTI